MPLSTSSSEQTAQWRRFFRCLAVMAAATVGVIYSFLVLVDPWGSLPVSLPLDRVPVTSNQRFSYPMLARSQQFDSVILGTSTSRLLRPTALNKAFGARFANLAMNSATPFETSSILRVFLLAHPAAKIVMLGVDTPWCVTGNNFQRLTPRPFPAWMYEANRWRGYAEMFNLYTIQEGGKEFGVVTGLKKRDMGRDGYTSFVPPDSTYDLARAEQHLVQAAPTIPSGERAGDAEKWRFPALELLQTDLAALPTGSRTILFVPPFNHWILSAPNTAGAAVWNECKRRVAALASTLPNTTVVDFMRPSPITDADDNYWDPLHYRVSVGDRIANDLIAAEQGKSSLDYQVLSRDAD
jgi:hypothetical protein